MKRQLFATGTPIANSWLDNNDSNQEIRINNGNKEKI